MVIKVLGGVSQQQQGGVAAATGCVAEVKGGVALERPFIFIF